MYAINSTTINEPSNRSIILPLRVNTNTNIALTPIMGVFLGVFFGFFAVFISEFIKKVKQAERTLKN